MHELRSQGDNRFLDMNSRKPTPEYCPHCQSKRKSSKLKFRFIGPVSGIWMCSNVECNFPLNSEDLQAFIVAVGACHDRKSKQHRSQLKRKRLCDSSKEEKIEAGNTPLHHTSNGSSVVISKPNGENGHASSENTTSQSIVPDDGLNAFPVMEKGNKMEKIQSILIGEQSEYRRGSEGSTSQSDFSPGDTEFDVSKVKSLTKYAPFVPKRQNEFPKSNEDATGFFILGSRVLAVECDGTAANKKESIAEETFDSAYSSPTSDNLNLQTDFLSLGNHGNPSFESAFKMIDSIFSDESKQENFLNPDFFLDDSLDNIVDLNAFP